MTQHPPPHQPRTILIAASSAVDVDALRLMLGHHQLQIQELNKGDQVLAAVNQARIALVLLDVTLAGSASFELCQVLSRPGPAQVTAPVPAPVPVFLLSATPSDDERQRAGAAGAYAYLALPFQADEMAEQILIALGLLSPARINPDIPRISSFDVNYQTMLAGSPDAVLLLARDSWRVLDANRGTRQLFGLTETELLQTDLWSLCPPLQPNGRSSADLITGQMAQVLAGEVRVHEAVFLHSSGRQIACEMRMMPLNSGQHPLMHMRIVDVTVRKQAEALSDGKNALLEMIANGAPLTETLDRLMLLIEAQSDGVQCSVLLLAPDGVTIQAASGPSMPPAYMKAIDGKPIGPVAGSCGTAMYLKETVVSPDIASDPLWAPYRDLAVSHGLRACWATPILLDRNTVLGSFAMYYREVRSPSAASRRLIDDATHIAGIAIARTRREEEIQRHRENLEEMVSARTAELQRANHEAADANEELTTALANLSLTQDELVRRDKLAALGALVAGVAHELNTPIGNSLMMTSSMSERTAALRRDLEGGLRRSVLDHYLEQAVNADELVLRNLNRAANLVDSFKRIAVDSGNSQRRRFMLGTQVNEIMLPLHAAVKGSGVALRIEIDAELEMDSYPDPLGQVLGHLFENSTVHGLAGRNGGTITIDGRATDSGEIALSLSDDGIGIPTADLTRIYDPFFTTRLGAGGSGLGLYITHNIVTGVLGGRINVRSVEGQGTTFTMLLPPVAPR
jgi:PAS domain S-box-containing protein